MDKLTKLAKNVIRLARMRGVTLSVVRKDGAELTLNARPGKNVTPYLRMAIPMCKEELIRLIEDEAAGRYVNANGHPELDITPCPTCGYRDIGMKRTMTLENGASVEIWGCFLCGNTPEAVERQIDDMYPHIKWDKKL